MSWTLYLRETSQMPSSPLEYGLRFLQSVLYQYSRDRNSALTESDMSRQLSRRTFLRKLHEGGFLALG